MAGADEWIPRLENEGEDLPNYVHPDYFTCKVYHGGYFDHLEHKYVGGSISYYDNVDKDKISLTEVDGIVRGINPSYVGRRIVYYYSIGSKEDATTKLNTDRDVVIMCCCVPEIRLVILYLEHKDLHGDDFEEEDDIFLYEQEILGFWDSQAASTGVVIVELPDSPRKPKCFVKIEELPPSPQKQHVKAKRYKVCASRKPLSALKITEHEEKIPTQTSRAPNIDPSDKGKKKVELVEEDEFEDDLDDGFQDEHIYEEYETVVDEEEGGEGDEEGSDDDDYNPAKDNDEYAGYGVDVDFSI